MLSLRLHDAGLFFVQYADDLVFTAVGDDELLKGYKIVHEWCVEQELEINKSKSALMHIRSSHRTPNPPVAPIGGIPIVTEYKYLGVLVDDILTFQPFESNIKDKLKTYKSQIDFSWTNKLAQSHRYLLWHSLVQSRLVYGAAIVASFHQSSKLILQRIHYYAL